MFLKGMHDKPETSRGVRRGLQEKDLKDGH